MVGPRRPEVILAQSACQIGRVIQGRRRDVVVGSVQPSRARFPADSGLQHLLRLPGIASLFVLCLVAHDLVVETHFGLPLGRDPAIDQPHRDVQRFQSIAQGFGSQVGWRVGDSLHEALNVALQRRSAGSEGQYQLWRRGVRQTRGLLSQQAEIRRVAVWTALRLFTGSEQEARIAVLTCCGLYLRAPIRHRPSSSRPAPI